MNKIPTSKIQNIPLNKEMQEILYDYPSRPKPGFYLCFINPQVDPGLLFLQKIEFFVFLLTGAIKDLPS
jgi:hypothetical protein